MFMGLNLNRCGNIVWDTFLKRMYLDSIIKTFIHEDIYSFSTQDLSIFIKNLDIQNLCMMLMYEEENNVLEILIDITMIRDQ